MVFEHKCDNVFLVGVMGSGKSTLGKFIARHLRYAFHDSDEEIKKRSGVDISWIFEQEGEDGFRRRESMVLTDCAKKNKVVLATGGGCVLVSKNVDLLMNNGIIIYLRVSLDMQLKRLSKNAGSRPLFMLNNTSEKLDQLNQLRAPLYESIADLTYDTDDFNPFLLSKKIACDCKVLAEKIRSTQVGGRP